MNISVMALIFLLKAIRKVSITFPKHLKDVFIAFFVGFLIVKILYERHEMNGL